MSNIYVTEPNTEGKVLLHTTFGDIDVELWPQQAPKACRNFVQLCLEGYYDNTIFHRVIKQFMIQGGDPTGTGTGGSSIYDQPFVDEFHTRLKFNHRGLLAMANENKPNSNHSQFFFTLDACEFLNKKHTIFGKITGNTIFNLLTVNDLETDSNDRPLNPPKFVRAEVLWNPFEDIVPRSLVKNSMNSAEDAIQKRKRERVAIRDTKLLSFGDEEEEVDLKPNKKKKIMSSHDLLEELPSQVHESLVQTLAKNENKSNENVKESLKEKVAAIAARNATVDKQVQDDVISETIQEVGEEKKEKKQKKKKKHDERDEYTRLREELRQHKKAVPLLLGEKAKAYEQAKAAHEMLTPLQQQRQKYLARKKAVNRTNRQQETLKRLEQFKATIQNVNHATSMIPKEKETEKTVPTYSGQILEEDDEGVEEDMDNSWMVAKLKFKKHIDDQFRNEAGQTVDNYVTIDSRQEKNERGSQRFHQRNDDRRKNFDGSRSQDHRRR